MTVRIEHIGDATLYLGDCLEIMPTLEPVDHVLTDPPYEQISQDRIGGIKRNDGGKVTEKLTFAGIDKIRDSLLASLPACSGWGLFFCTSEGVAPWRDSIEAAGFRYKTPMIWVKPDAMPKFNGQGAALGHENIVSAWLGKGHTSWNGGGKRGVFTHLTNQPDRDGRHPTEKPGPLMAELVILFTQPNDVILDPFAGSGSTGVACAKHGRRFIGIERDQKWFDVACERIEAAYRQPRLFQERPAKVKQDSFLDGAA
jgi:DNA modification methylase